MVRLPWLDRRTVLRSAAAGVGASLLSGSAAADGGNEGENEEEGTQGGGGQREEGRREEDSERCDTTLIGHRGFAGVAPENTVGAMELAAKGGTSARAADRRADMVEIDVVPCGGRPHEGEAFEVVAFHDDRLSSRDSGERGLTDADGLVWETPCETVESAEVLESGETVPTMREVFEALPPSVGVNVEFKNPGDAGVAFGRNLDSTTDPTLAERKEVWRPFTGAVLDIAAEFDNEILVSSFMEAALATVREAAPDIPVAFLFWDSIQEGLAVTEEYDAEALHPPLNMIRDSPFFGDAMFSFDNVPDGGFEDVDLVAEAHDAGREVNVWTVRSWYEAERMLDADVDGLISDFPNLLRSGAVDE